MHIKNGIAYAENREPILEVVSVRALDNYVLWLRFNNGKTKEFDFKPLLDKPAFVPLKDKAVFNDVYVDISTCHKPGLDFGVVYVLKSLYV